MNIQHVHEWSFINPFALKIVNPRIYCQGLPTARDSLMAKESICSQIKSVQFNSSAQSAAAQHSLIELFKGQDLKNKLICGGFIRFMDAQSR